MRVNGSEKFAVKFVQLRDEAVMLFSSDQTHHLVEIPICEFGPLNGNFSALDITISLQR